MLGTAFPATLAAAVLLAGCSPMPVAPPDPTDAEVEAHIATVLDGTWENLDLPAGTVRPVNDSPGVLATAEWWEELSGCMEDLGILSWGLASSSSGYRFVVGNNEALPPELSLGAYSCLTEYVEDPVASGTYLTDAQADYLWEYYQRWQVPCVQREGFTMWGLPMSREQFDTQRSEGYVWSPYHGVTIADQRAGRRLLEHCGPERGELGGGQWFFGPQG